MLLRSSESTLPSRVLLAPLLLPLPTPMPKPAGPLLLPPPRDALPLPPALLLVLLPPCIWAAESLKKARLSKEEALE